MQYQDYLLNVLKWDCPFCDINTEFILEKWKYFTVIMARAPYIENHLLIVPNRHLIRLNELNETERWALMKMIERWSKKLEKIHKEVNILLRDGVKDWKLGKSVDHLHFHLVPDCEIFAKTSWWSRKAYSDYWLIEKTKKLKKNLK